MKVQKQIANTAYKSEGFIKHYQELIRKEVIPYQYDILMDRVEDAEKSHAIMNFINAGKALLNENDHDGFYGMVFQDSDVAKWLEAVAFSLSVHPDKELEKIADEVISYVAKAQDEDGYLDTYFIIKDQDKRWTNLLEGHELYCAGHMMEAAVAYYEATGKDVLLNTMKKCADHIYHIFVEEKREGYPGHPEVELALMKMYRATGEKKYLDLAKHFIDVRGVDPYFYEKEVANRDWVVWGNNAVDHDYQQSGRPVREQKDATGHSVRAVYLYTAMADLMSETEDEELLSACRTLWNSIVERRMYVTGAIGSTYQGEAFTVDYNLPNDTVYGETCASIGLMYFASRMLENEVKGEYADVMERAFYNTVLAGMQLDGKRFFYVNPLEVIPGISGIAVTHKHVVPVRPKWYACACCPPNVARTISSFGKYAYGENETTAYCHLFAEGDVSFANGLAIHCATNYPYGFSVTYTVEAGEGTLAVRLPGWSEKNTVTCNGKEAGTCKDGYCYVDVKAGDEVKLVMDDSIQRIYASSLVANVTGAVALQRGPLVYCVESVDNEDDVLSLYLPEDGQMTAEPYNADLLSGTVMISVEGGRKKKIKSLYTNKKPEKENCTIKAVPYYTWGNRGQGQMRVWIPEN